jgi:hypothetical protein
MTDSANGSRLLLQTITTSTPQVNRRVSINPLYTAAQNLLKSIEKMRIPRIPIEPQPGDLQELGLHLMEFAEYVDRYVHEVGWQLSQNSPCNIDMACFTRVLTDAVTGATYEAERAAQELREERL